MVYAEATSEARRLGLAAAFFAGAGVFALLGWTVLTVALATLLTRWLPVDASLAIAAGLNFAIGGALGLVGYRKISNPSSFDLLVPLEKLPKLDDEVKPPGFAENPTLTEPKHA